MLAAAVLWLGFVQTPRYDVVDVAGWTVHIRKELAGAPETDAALKLLDVQLKQIVEVVPKKAVEHLKTVQLWFSPEYPGFKPRAEYHPGADWLRENGRDPAMVRGIEFTNIRIFAAETRRMPNFALHELAHAYHDQVLSGGFANKDVAEAYQRSKASKTYDDVERQDSEGKRTRGRAYAMTNPMEYFAELSEAYFAKNDFFPFDRSELTQADPKAVAMLEAAWKVGQSDAR